MMMKENKIAWEIDVDGYEMHKVESKLEFLNVIFIVSLCM